ncbi:MAG: hypothetical protein KAQ85_06250 [Thermodesulfovibrionia bacterium]|nr:hypothetical protein [Thermodesulfovibrionia bacterium]
MKQFIILILLILSLFAGTLFAQEGEMVEPMAVTTDIPATTDLHYTGKFCKECHEKIPEKGKNKFLKYDGNFTQLCWCHGYEPGSYIHPVDVVPSEEKKSKIPENLPLKDGKIYCGTCHDIYMQCQDNPEMKQWNKRFLRGAPYSHRTDLCFYCHDEKKYKMLDPHDQLNANGDIIVEKCLYCHIEKPDEVHATFKDVKLVGNLEILCQRCHGERSHPAGKNHLRKPSEMTLAVMKQEAEKFNIVLPLDYDGKITCSTCHNPHERGIIPAERAGAKGASERFRHRLPGSICLACHQK